MYLMVPSGLLTEMYDGFSKGVRHTKHWVNLGDGTWKFVYKWDIAVYKLRIQTIGGKKSCKMDIVTDAATYEFDVHEMELQNRLAPDNTPMFKDLLIIRATEKETQKKGEFFLCAYDKEEIVWKMNHKYRTKK